MVDEGAEAVNVEASISYFYLLFQFYSTWMQKSCNGAAWITKDPKLLVNNL